MNKPEIEILVHIAAPTSAAHDAKYRSLAAAYLSFEPITPGSVVHGSPTLDEQDFNSGLEGTGKASSQVEHGFLPTSSFGFIDSPVLSFRSAADNVGSPRLRRPNKENKSEAQPSWQPPPSVVDDSMPDNDFAFTEYCTPTRILEHYTSTMDSSQSDTSPIPQRAQSQTLPVATQPPVRNTGGASADASNGQYQPTHGDPGTVIPLTPAENYRKRRQPTPTSSILVEETRIASSYPSQASEATSSFRAESEPPPLKRPRASQDPGPCKALVRSVSDTGPELRRAYAHVPYHNYPDTLEILSPPPLTSQGDLRPEDMVTDVLASLARELDLSKRFKPELQTRDLRPFERGYWLVDCSSWEPDLKRSAWKFLSDYLSKGAAGWGTSCKRDRDFTSIRMYCWGCVVGHMYLVLYLMSRRRVLYTGTSWIGAEGNAVVVMGQRRAQA